MKINIFMKGITGQHHGALVTITDRDEFERDGMKRYCWIEFEKCDELIAAANEHYKAWNGTIIELNTLLENQQPVVIRDELIYALNIFAMSQHPFVARWLDVFSAGSPFVTQIERRTLDATAV